MTTIVWDGKVLACDSRETGDNILSRDNMNKLFVIEQEIKYKDDILLVYSLAGSVSDMEIIHDYINSPLFPIAAKMDHDCNGIFIGINKVYLLEPGTGMLIAYNRSQKLTIGSGEHIALGAIGMGADAIKAVQIACKYDVYSGGKIQSWRK